MKRHKRIIPALLAALAAVFFPADASDNIVNLGTPVTATSFFRYGDTLWTATAGGLQIHNLKTGNKEFVSNSRIFPDLHLTSVSRDGDGNIWIGSRKGYLYRRTPRGQFTTYSNYKISDWGITSLYFYDGFLIVGSTKGVSLFDPRKGVAFRNANKIANFANSKVNAITSLGDTLFLGLNEGIAYLDGLDAVPLVRRNFYDSGIWKVEYAKDRKPIVDFVNSGYFVVPASAPAAWFREKLITTDSTGWLFMSGEPLARVFSGIGLVTSLHNEDDRRLWIGTDENYYYSFDGEAELVLHTIDGLPLRRATRTYIAADGVMWLLPHFSHRYSTWHHAVYRFDGQNWHRYNNYSHPGQFGYLGDGSDAIAIASGANGTVWIGTWGGNVKHIDPVRNTVAQLIVGNTNFSDIHYTTDESGPASWGKVDALAMDSSGYLWLSIYDSDYGSLICYDPRYPPDASFEGVDHTRARYRRFFTDVPLKTLNISALSAGPSNRIFAYDGQQNRLTIFSHNGSPLADSIAVNKIFDRFGTVASMELDEDGTTYIAGEAGIFRIAAGSLEMETIDKSITDISSMAVQENVLWLGTYTRGVLRYDIENRSVKKEIDESAGLPSSNIASVALDKKNGRLWIVTDEGVSWLDVGRVGVKISTSRNLRAFPNVFSVSGSAQGTPHITFAELEERSSVAVYTVSGSLVAKTDAEHFANSEWRAVWSPKRTLAPGTYIAVAKPSGKKTKIILKP